MPLRLRRIPGSPARRIRNLHVLRLLEVRARQAGEVSVRHLRALRQRRADRGRLLKRGESMNTYSVYYMKPEFFRDGSMGPDWLKGKGKLPDAGALDKTHVFLLEAKAPDLEALIMAMQGENWSPNGEARPLIEARGLE